VKKTFQFYQQCKQHQEDFGSCLSTCEARSQWMLCCYS